MSIKILSPAVANQIAAGEVVERPASVVKELIENSIDAGADDIRVETREGGRRLIRVQDNGCGIQAADAGLVFERHATSKLTSVADLDHLQTLGFRGEALASIASVARTTLLTRSQTENTGTLIRIEGGKQTLREPRGTVPGTTVTVEHLFADVPARLKFLKQPATEAGHIVQIVTRHALAHPERRFSLVQDGRLVFQSSGSGKLHDVLVKVYGPEMAKQMLPVSTDDGTEQPGNRRPISVSGFVAAPSQHRSNRSHITLFVNRRWFQDTSLAFAVIQAYHTMLPTGRYPIALVFLEVDPSDVDVNVHPTKAEVRFGDGRATFSAVQRAVRRTLTELAPVPALGPASTGPEAWALPADGHGSGEAEAAWALRRQALLDAGSHSAVLPGSAQSPDGHAPGGDPVQLTMPALSRGKPLLPVLRVVGQLATTYIVAEGPDGMYLIDQHAAHERILYEQVLAARSENAMTVQTLLDPLVLHLEQEQAADVGENMALLAALGVDIQPFGSNSYLVRSVPAILSHENPESAMTEIIDGLAEGSDAVAGADEAQLIRLICKRAAIKAGQVLSMAEMRELVHQLEKCQAPRTCPHGRPTMIVLNAGELARQFGRA